MSYPCTLHLHHNLLPLQRIQAKRTIFSRIAPYAECSFLSSHRAVAPVALAEHVEVAHRVSPMVVTRARGERR